MRAACDNMVQEMEGKKVYPKNGLYWGTPQVVYLKWKCTGTPIAVDKLNYLRPPAYVCVCVCVDSASAALGLSHDGLSSHMAVLPAPLGTAVNKG
jgi:hypothetical protein